MARPKALQRKYRITDANLVQLADAMRQNLQRDAADMASYGIDAATLTALQALRTGLSSQQNDEYYVGRIVSATASVEAARTALISKLNNLEARVAAKLGTDDGRTLSLGIRAISAETPDQLTDTAVSAHTTATTLLPDLADTGVDAAYLTDLDTKRQALDAAIDERTKRRSERLMATQARVTAGNLLWTELVRLASLGKVQYENNFAKYQDYVLTETSEASGDIRSGTLATGGTTPVTHEEILGEEQFEFKLTSGTAYKVHFATTATGAPTGTQTTITGTVTHTALSLGWEVEKPFMVLTNDSGAAAGWRIKRLPEE